METVPQSVDEISASWIEETLRGAGALADARVAAVHPTLIGVEIGFLSLTARVAIDYDGPAAAAPSSVIVKLEPAAGSFRTAERGLKAFPREIRFYQEIGPQLAMRLPRIFHAAVTPAGCLLVMEDLANLRFVDQLHGLRQAEVVMTVREIAKVHARFWERTADPALDWIPAYDHFWEDDFAIHWPAFAATYELRIGRDGVRLGERLAAGLDRVLARIRERPATVIHADLRADNLLFAPDAAYILDWQLITRSLATIDIARLLGGSEPSPERRGHQLEVFAAWHEALLAAGVAGYTLDEALDDFRLAVLYSLLVPVKSFSMVGPNAGVRSGRLVDAQAERLFASALELDAGAALD